MMGYFTGLTPAYLDSRIVPMKIFSFLLLIAAGLTFQPSVTIDGKLGRDEWKGAREAQLNNGNKLLIRTESNILYVAIQGEKNLWAHAYLSDGNVVKVMHISAALDAVQYTKSNNLWLTSDTFQYEMRDRVYSPEVETKMNAYYLANDWVASNVNMGGGNVAELKINLEKWKGPLYAAFVVANTDRKFNSWPKNLKDDTVLPRLVEGYTPDSLRFELAAWEKIKN